MQPVRFYINVTIDGCYDHHAASVDQEVFQYAHQTIERADALIFGRVTYELMEEGWRSPALKETRPDWMGPFADTINAAKKYVASKTLKEVDWSAELLRGDLGEAVRQLKQQPGKGLFVGGAKLALALTEMGLIDEYEFMLHPQLAGHGPYLFAGLSKHVELKLVGRREFASGAVAMRYEPKT